MTYFPGQAPYWIDPDDPDIAFPDVEQALTDPDGLLAIGGDLRPERLLRAYRSGIFPWFGPDQPILWWAPDPRLVLFPGKLHVSRSLAKTLRKQPFDFTLDTAFDDVIRHCAAPRAGQAGTWITDDMMAAYSTLHALGHAHSVECWQAGQLVGGLYGVSMGRVFFGESMFARVADASKAGFVMLVRQLRHWGFRLVDCQVHTNHLASLGATLLPRREFNRLVGMEITRDSRVNWVFDTDILANV